MKHKLLSLFVALVATTALWASNTITYTATKKLTRSSLNIGQTTFGPAITSHTFSNDMGTITCSGDITTIGNYAFYDCSGLTSITIPNSVITIGDDAFEYCSGLTSATIPNSVTTIGNYAFGGCSGLTSVTIPNSVTTIGGGAFAYCTGLTYITIPNSVTTIGSHVFEHCGLTSVTIPNSVTTIGDNAFYECYSLTSVTIPNSVTTIGGGAFARCYRLTSITIPNSVTAIGYEAFRFCSGLTSVMINSNAICSTNSMYCIDHMHSFFDSQVKEYVIGNSVKTIGDDMFHDCSGLKSVTIPNSVTTIGKSAFSGCSGLTSIMCYAINPPTCSDFAPFSSVDKFIPVYVPTQSVDAYKQADEWKNFTNILPIAAEETEVTEPVINADDHSVTITWPQTDNADTYTLEIRKNGELVCTLTFNSQGIMTNITFAAPARGGERTASAAEMTVNGYKFTVTGLEANTEYTYAVTAKNASAQPIQTYSGKFRTTGTTGLDGLTMHNAQCTVKKMIRNNRLLIVCDGKCYNALGGKMR